jgi:hypothetical protein
MRYLLALLLLASSASADRIAVSGCSQTRDWIGDGVVPGYEDIVGEDLFSTASGYGGGTVSRWIMPGSASTGYLAQFENNTDGTENFILAQLCVRNGQGSYADVLTLIDELKARVPGVPVYLMPLDVPTATCANSGYEESISFMNQAVTDSIALQGPVLDPPYAPNETRDGCHPNAAGAARMTATVQAWLAGEPMPPPPPPPPPPSCSGEPNQCRDNCDNDGDGYVDRNDPQCTSPYDDDEGM